MRSNVDLPAPLGPSTVRNSPAPMLKLAPDQTVRPWYPDARAVASITGLAGARFPGSADAPQGTAALAAAVTADSAVPFIRLLRVAPGPGRQARRRTTARSSPRAAGWSRWQ